jgi:hypothetical protein
MLKDVVTHVSTLHFAFYDSTTEEAYPWGKYKTLHALHRSTFRAISDEQQRLCCLSVQNGRKYSVEIKPPSVVNFLL